MAANPKSQAVRDRWEKDATCPKCGAMNVPGNRVIELEPTGTAVCCQCGTGWKPVL